MSAGRIIIRCILAAASGIVILVAAALYAVTSTPLAGKLVSSFTEGMFDADLDFSRFDLTLFSSWPEVRVRVDSLSVTYPHSRFEMVAMDGMQQDGCGDQTDTLLRCAALSLSANLESLIRGSIDISGIEADGARVYAHSYGNGMANWNVFQSSDEGGGMQMPAVSLRRARISDAMLVMSSKGGLWRIAVPVDAEFSGSMEADSLCTRIAVDSLNGNVAWVPLSLSGSAELRDERTDISAKIAARGIPLRTVVCEYLYAFLPEFKGVFEADGSMDVDAGIEGSMSEGCLPAVSARVKLPSGHFDFRPYRMAGKVSFDGRFNSDEKMVVDASISKLTASLPGLDIKASGHVDKFFGKDPRYRINVDASSVLGTLSDTYLRGTGIAVGGEVAMRLEVDAHQSQLDRYHFPEASIKGSLNGTRLDIQYDSLVMHGFAPSARLSSGPGGLAVGIDMDSTFVSSGDVRAKVRNTRNLAHLSRQASGDGYVPAMEILSENGSIFVDFKGNRGAVRNASLVATAKKRGARRTAGMRRRAVSDTVSWDERRERIEREHTVREFRDKDVRVYLDSSLTALIRQWDATAGISSGRGFVASPILPLRTRLGALKAYYDGSDLRLDSLALTCGTSDIQAAGRLRNVQRIFSRRHSFIDARLAVKSSRINVNELVAALDYAREHIPSTLEIADDGDESFVLDSIPDAAPPSSDLLLVVPGNVDAEFSLKAGRLDYRDFCISPVRLRANVRENTLQLLDVFADAGIGKLEMDAFYSTKSRKDISAGAGMLLKDILAEDVIQVLPFVDSLIPALKSFKGRLDCKLSADASFDENMNLITPSLQGVLDISGRNLRIDDAGDLRRITKLLMFKNKNIGEIDDLSVSAVVKDSKIEIYPFQIGVDRYRFALQGVQGFDKTMDYHVSVLKSPLLIPFGIYVKGSLDNWHFGLTKARYSEGSVPAYSKQLDSVSINFAQSIHDVFRMGVDGVRRYNSKSLGRVDSPMNARRISGDDMLDRETYKKLEAMKLDDEIAAQEAELRASIEAMFADF